MSAGSVHPAVLREVIGAFRGALRDRGVISLFLRLHPLLRLPDGGFAGHGELVTHGHTVAVDLSISEAEMWSQTRANHRRGINKLRQEGYVTSLDCWSHYPAFFSIYRQTMLRVGASEGYFFSDEYFRGLRDALGDRLHLMTVVSPDGDVVCGGLFPATNGIIQYHLGGTASDYLAVAPSKLMFHEMRIWGKAAGYRWLHLGGGVGGCEDALAHFKRGFSPIRAAFQTFRMIIDEARYRQLCAKRLVTNGSRVPSFYFPAYRAPMSVAMDTVNASSSMIVM
jgi:lipid II:glycine glycyltransferase (peptidoglycan interpeptide bridge formation enzyme)